MARIIDGEPADECTGTYCPHCTNDLSANNEQSQQSCRRTGSRDRERGQNRKRVRKVKRKIGFTVAWLVALPVMGAITMLRQKPNSLDEVKKDATYGFLGDIIEKLT